MIYERTHRDEHGRFALCQTATVETHPLDPLPSHKCPLKGNKLREDLEMNTRHQPCESACSMKQGVRQIGLYTVAMWIILCVSHKRLPLTYTTARGVGLQL